MASIANGGHSRAYRKAARYTSMCSVSRRFLRSAKFVVKKIAAARDKMAPVALHGSSAQ
jgi:hypothetical protein